MFDQSKRLWRLALAMALTTGVGSAAADPGVTDKEIAIGHSITLQGGKNAYGTAAHDGMKLYIDAVNATGGVHGRQLTLRTLDDQNNNATAEANARQLVQDGVFVLFGAVEGGPSTAVAKVATETKVPFFGPMAGPPGLRRPHQPMVFPVRAEHRDEFRALMEWGHATGLKTVGFLHADSPRGLEHVKNVDIIAKELGMTVVQTLPMTDKATDEDIEKAARAIAEIKPDLFFNHGSANLYQRLLKRAKATGVKTAFMGVNSGSSQIAAALGPLAQGMVFAQVVPSPWQRKHEISREYQAAVRQAGGKLALSYGGLEGFMTAKALVMALRATGRDLTRASFVRTLQTTPFDLGGVRARYDAGDHQGSHFVDLSMVTRDGQFIH
ncbi:MAG TPA: ABC transporter substrate-binding protein [Methylibium sp.]|nr:ABC transporter substrate-binding protein [Methylibium sp.]